MNNINKINFTEDLPAIFGFREIWKPLEKIFPTHKIYKNSSYMNHSEAAFLDLNGAKNLLLQAEKLSLSSLSNEELKYKVKKASENVQILKNKFSTKLELNSGHEYFRGDFLQLSKKSIVDFIQENISNYYQNKKLTPIIFGLEIEINGNSSFEKNFTPKLKSVINKENNSYTAAELRTIYKLVKEIPDEEIRFIANQSFRFVKLVKTVPDQSSSESPVFKVESINPPWSGPAETEWTNRKRKENRDSYEIREENLPTWVERLISHKMREKNCNPILKNLLN